MPSFYLLLTSQFQESSKLVFLKARTSPARSSPSTHCASPLPLSWNQEAQKLVPRKQDLLTGIRKKRGLRMMLRI